MYVCVCVYINVMNTGSVSTLNDSVGSRRAVLVEVERPKSQE